MTSEQNCSSSSLILLYAQKEIDSSSFFSLIQRIWEHCFSAESVQCFHSKKYESQKSSPSNSLQGPLDHHTVQLFHTPADLSTNTQCSIIRLVKIPQKWTIICHFFWNHKGFLERPSGIHNSRMSNTEAYCIFFATKGLGTWTVQILLV